MNSDKFMCFPMVLPYLQLMVDGCFGASGKAKDFCSIGTNLGARPDLVW